MTAAQDAKRRDPALRPVFATLMLALLLAALDHTTVATALPRIVGDLGDLSQLAWVVTAYMLAATIAAPVIGRLSDQLGRKRVYQAAIGVFVLGALLSGSATSLGQLVAFRFLQGTGAGGVIALTQTIIADLVSPRERGRYQGLLGAVFGFASVAGPLLGGLFVDHATWRFVFWMNVPLGLLALAVIQTRLHLPQGSGRRRIDWFGTALLTGGVTALLLAVSWGGNVLAWDAPALFALVAGGACALAGFVLVQRRVSEPIVPLRLFGNRVFAVGSALSFVCGVGMFGTIVFTPLFLQTVLEASATASGLLLLPLLAGFICSSITAGRLITRWGRYKPFPIAGTVLATAGLWRMSTLGPSSSHVDAGVAMAVTGLGLGMVVQVVVIAVQNSVEREDLGSATSLAQFFRTIGGTIGITLYGALLNARLAGGALERLGSGTVDELLHSPARIAALPPATRTAVLASLSDGITFLFALSVPVLAVGILLALALPELHLHTDAAAPSPRPTRHRSPRSRQRSQRRVDDVPMPLE